MVHTPFMTTDNAAADKFARATGRSAEQWRSALDAAGGRGRSHQEIAALALDLMPADITGNAEWWAQSVTIEYERATGARDVGQRCDGDFAVSASKTVHCGLDEARERWQAAIAEHLAENDDTIDGIAFAEEPRLSDTDKWRYWRVALADGTKVDVTIGASGASSAKSSVAVQHEKLGQASDRDRWKPVWKSVLARMPR